MSEQRQSNTPFVKKEFDEFNDKATTTHISTLKCGGNVLGWPDYFGEGGTLNFYEFQLRLVKTKNVQALLLDCNIRAEDWFHAREGNIIFNCDQENHEIKYQESNTDVQTSGQTAYCHEYGFYELTQVLLKQLCDAKILKIRICGDHSFEQPGEKWCVEFQKYCRQYYNSVFDSSLYPEVVAGGLTKSGCFVATAAMGSYDDPAVQVLTQFRDAILLRSFLGRQSVHCYYAISPGIASWMRGKNWMCRFAKWFFVLPASKIVALMLRKGSDPHNRTFP